MSPLLTSSPCIRTNRIFFFFNDTATTEIYTLSLHDALPIYIAFHAGRVILHHSVVADDQRDVPRAPRSEEHTSELQSPCNLVCRLLLEKKNQQQIQTNHERQKQPYGRQHTYHHYRPQRPAYEKTESLRMQGVEFDNGDMYRSEERFSRNAETDLVCRLLLE